MTRLAYSVSRTLTGQVDGGVSDAIEEARGGVKLTALLLYMWVAGVWYGS
jgi:hypothetical protein